MRILSWNINGIRTLPKYHPWNTFKTCEGILDELKADIICFQEMKSSRASLPRDVALPGPYHSFFSFPESKGGYSGVAVYVKSSTITPCKAEEGLSGKLQPNPPLSPEERISSSYPSPDHMVLYPDEEGNTPSSFDALDSEGRGLVIDFGLFVLINVYCPNETSEERLAFKMNYHLLLQERVRELIMEDGREVLVVGDINVCAAPIDHCDGHLPSNIATFYDHPARAWLRQWIGPEGPMTDVIRQLHPNRKGLFTCWNQRIQARTTNYGTRIDYMLVTKGLLPWVSGGDIQPSLKGSDHCPVYIDLHDELTLPSGETLTLRDAMTGKTVSRPDDPPRIAARFWDEHSAKQMVLSAFFGKQGVTKRSTSPPSATQSDSGTPQISTPTPTPPNAHDLTPPPVKKLKLRPSQSHVSSQPVHKRKSSETQPTSKKRKAGPAPAKGQASIAAFLSKPSAAPLVAVSSSPQQQEVIDVDGDDASDAADQLDADYRLALALSSDPPHSSSQPSSSSQNTGNAAAAWSSLFAPVQPPRCTVHDETARLYTVSKPGPNKGKTFYLCARPVGPGYDKGRAERRREEVDHRYRCDYFKWASHVRREAVRERDREKGKT